MNRSKKLISNSLVFVIGNLGSKLISFIMVPMYTYYLSTSQFGTIDLMMTTINLCLPLVSLSIFDAVFRFAMDKTSNKAQVLSTGVFTTLLLVGVVSAFSPIILIFFKVPYMLFLVLILISTALFSMFQNFTRAIGYSKIFAFSGIINTACFAALNVLLIIVLKGGVEAYLESYLIAMAIAIFYLFCRARLWNYLSVKDFSLSQMKRMLAYSIPLIPNALAWWFTNDASRFFILAFVGVSANGLFAVANKIPTIINMFFNVFTQAWQISAVDEYDSDDSAEYYSSIFKKLQQFLFVLFALIVFFIKPIVQVLFSANYYTSWKYVPILLLAVVFADMTSFLGSAYLAAKRTVGVFTTTVYGMLINLLVSGILTAKIGVYGAGIGMSLGFLAVILLRLKGVKRYIAIKMPWKTFIYSLLSIGIMCIGLYSNIPIVSILLLLIGLLINVYINWDIIRVGWRLGKSIVLKFTKKQNPRD